MEKAGPGGPEAGPSRRSLSAPPPCAVDTLGTAQLRFPHLASEAWLPFLSQSLLTQRQRERNPTFSSTCKAGAPDSRHAHAIL